MKPSLSLVATLFGLSLVGCDQPTTTTTTQRSATTNSYRLTGNRSADPLGNYSSDNSGTGMTPDASSVAQRSGSYQSTSTVRGGR